jgi:hypothetical protein
MITWLLNLPRAARIGLVLMAALAVVLALFALIDRIYILYLMTPETVAWPSYVAAAIGLAMYTWGWMLFVSTRGAKLRVSRGMNLYLAVVAAAVCVDVALIIQGLFMTDLLAG